MDKKLEEKLNQLQKEYAKKKRKLKKYQRSAKAKAHVKQKLLEQQGLSPQQFTDQKEEILTDNQMAISRDLKQNTVSNQAAADKLDSSNGAQSACPCSEKVNLIKITEPELVSETDEESASQRLESSCEIFTPVSLDVGGDQEINNNSGHQACVKIDKYTNKKIVTKLQQSNTLRSKLLRKTNSPLSSRTSSFADSKTATTQEQHGTDDSNPLTRSSSNSECQMDVLIYERTQDTPKRQMHSDNIACISDSKEIEHSNTENKIHEDDLGLSVVGGDGTELNTGTPNKISSQNVQHLASDSEKGPIFNESAKLVDLANTAHILNDDNLCKDVRVPYIDQVNVSQGFMVDNLRLCNTESSQTSSVHSDDIFDTEEIILKRRTRKGKRRSTSLGRQRQSARIAELSSQDNSSSSSQSYVGVKSPVYCTETLVKVKKQVLISSMFQCLVDEVKRKGENEFNIPVDYLKTKIDKNPEDIKEALNLISSTDTAQPNLNSQTNDNETKSSSLSLERLKLSNNASTEGQPRTTEIQRNSIMNIASIFDEEEIGNKSPTLFESQTLTDTLKKNALKDDTDSSFCEAEDEQTRKSITVINDVQYFALPKNDSTDSDKVAAKNNNQCEATVRVSYTNEGETSDAKLCFEQEACFQVPEYDQLLAMEAVVVVSCGEILEYVACLCTADLKLYNLQAGCWRCVATENHSTNVRKNSVFRIYSWLGQADVSIVLQLTRSDSTTLTNYTYRDSCLKRTQLVRITSKGVCCCPVYNHQLIVTRWTGQQTHLTRYGLDTTSDQWSLFDLESCDNKIVSMATIQHINTAVAGFTSQRVLHIWNHACGFLLSTVDLSDVCPRDFVCPAIYQEKGYLFLPLLTRKKCTEAGSIIVVNPQLGISEALTSLQAGDQAWFGCCKTTILDNFLISMETHGRLSILDLFTGHLLAAMDDAGISCFTTSKGTIFLAHKQCVHVFTEQS